MLKSVGCTNQTINYLSSDLSLFGLDVSKKYLADLKIVS